MRAKRRAHGMGWWPAEAGVAVAGLALALAMAPAPVLAEGPAQQVKPVVVFLLDTSGSMEYDVAGYSAETDDEDVLAVPVCTGVAGSDGKSRFAVAIEVLTGAFADDTYSCTYDPRVWPANREDFGYAVPHVIPHGVQLENGLIDIAGDRFKFGVMTFDTVANPSPQAAGGYSYGGEFPVNYGARNEDAPTGWFVSPAASDHRDDVLARNSEVEMSIVSAVPFGGTPLAPILRDALDYFQNDPALQPYDAQAGTGDLYHACRSRNVVLITDGRANLGEGTDGYLTAALYAGQLLASGVKVYVVGFQLPSGVESLVNAIAAAGGTQEARIVTNPAQLAAVLSKILGNMETAIQSRTRIAVTQDTGNFTDRQYQFSAAYGLVEGRPGLFRGYLERSVYQCESGDEATVTEVQSLADKLNARTDSDRTVWTVKDGVLTPFSTSNDALTLDVFGIAVPDQPGRVLLERRAPTLDGGCEPVPPPLDAYDEAERDQYVDYLIDYIRAAPGSCRHPYKLGAIVHSSPAIQGHLRDVDVAIPSFRTYKLRTAFAQRPTVLYVGTHDGMIHAFQVDRPDTSAHQDWGQELWAFLPNHLLRRLKDLPNRFQVLMDGEPVVKDILLSRTTESLLSAEAEADRWRAVLVTGYGKGGRGYVALDVTDPTAPAFLWEISPEGRWWVQNGSPQFGLPTQFENDFTRLGYTVSRPSLGTVFIGSEEVAVAVFGGGSGEGLCGGVGRSVFVVRLDTGEKLKEFASGVSPPNVEDPCGVGGGNGEPLADLVGDVTCYSTFPGTFVTRCFLGDRAGRLWRADLGRSSTALWKLQLFFDPYESVSPPVGLGSAVRAPATEAPAVAVKPYRPELVVVFGGGDTDRIDDRTAKNFVASLTETQPAQDLLHQYADCSPFHETVCRDTNRRTAVLNWKVFLGFDEHLHEVVRPADDELQATENVQGERLMGAPVIFSNTVYFTTFGPDLANACSPGIGWLWGVDFYQRGEDCMSPAPRLDRDDLPNQRVKVRIGGSAGASIPYGLTVVQRPSCFRGQTPGNALPPSECPTCTPLAALTPPKPQVIVQTAVQASATADTIPLNQEGTPPNVAKMTRNILNVVQTMLVSAWGFIFD